MRTLRNVEKGLDFIKEKLITDTVRENIAENEQRMKNTPDKIYPEKYMAQLKADPLFWTKTIFYGDFNKIYKAFFTEITTPIEEALAACAMTVLLAMRSDMPDSRFIEIIMSGNMDPGEYGNMRRGDFRKLIDCDKLAKDYIKLKEELCKQLSIQENHEYVPNANDYELVVDFGCDVPLYMHYLYWMNAFAINKAQGTSEDPAAYRDMLVSKLDIRRRVQNDDNYFYQLAVAIMAYANVTPYKEN